MRFTNTLHFSLLFFFSVNVVEGISSSRISDALSVREYQSGLSVSIGHLTVNGNRVMNCPFASVDSEVVRFRVPLCVPPSVALESKCSEKSISNISTEEFGSLRGERLVVLTFTQRLPANQKVNATIQVTWAGTVTQSQRAKSELLLFKYVVLNPHISYRREEQRSTSSLLDVGWYDPNKSWVTITTQRDGLAFIAAKRVIASNTVFANVESKKLRLFHNGSELEMMVTGDANGRLDDSDTLIFVGSRPTVDTTWMSEYSTTEPFYLTFDSQDGKRFKPWSVSGNGVESSGAQVSTHVEEDHVYFIGDIPVGKNAPDDSHPASIHRSEKVKGEGWYWKILKNKNRFVYNRDDVFTDTVFTYNFRHRQVGSAPYLLKVGLHGLFDHQLYNVHRNEWTDVQQEYQLVAIIDDDTVDVRTFSNQFLDVWTLSLPSEKWNGDDHILRLVNIGNVALYTDSLFASDVGIDFVEHVGSETSDKSFFGNSALLVNETIPVNLKVTGFKEAGTVLVVDTVSKQFDFLKANVDVAGHSCAVPLDGQRRYSLLLSQVAELEESSVTSTNKTSLRSASSRADILVIASGDHLSGAEEWANYRSRKSGLVAVVVDCDDVYKEFSFGKKTPQAIKDFLFYAQTNWRSPHFTHVVLFGDASWDPRLSASGSNQIDYVPTYGKPVSDQWYSFDLSNPETSHIQQFVVSRIPVHSNDEANAYLEKVKSFESLSSSSWMKRLFFISGGDGQSQRESWCAFKDDVSHFVNSPTFCGESVYVCRLADGEPTTGTYGEAIRSQLRQGVCYTNFIGHGSPTIIEYSGWYANDLDNENRCGFLTTTSCQTGAFAEPGLTSRNEEWLTVPKVGFTGILGHTGFGYTDKAQFALSGTFESIFADGARSYGELLLTQSESLQIGAMNDIRNHNTIYQMNLLGDPFIRLPFDTVPDYFLDKEHVNIISSSGRTIPYENDEFVSVNPIPQNYGINDTIPMRIVVTREFQGSIDTVSYQFRPYECRQQLSRRFGIKGMVGTHQLTFTIDPDGISSIELSRENNVFKMSFEVFAEGLLTIDPQLGWDVQSSSPTIRMMFPPGQDSSTATPEMEIIEDKETPSMIIQSEVTSIVFPWRGTVDWKPSVSLQAGKRYFLRSRLFDKQRNKFSPWATILFYASDSITKNEAHVRGDFARDVPSSNINGYSRQLQDSSRTLFLSRSIPIWVFSEGRFLDEDGKDVRMCRIDVNGIRRVGSAFTGFNLVTIPVGDTAPVISRNYQTFDTIGCRALLNILRDSVVDETIVLATGDEAFTGFVRLGLLDSLKSTLSLFGAKKFLELKDSVVTLPPNRLVNILFNTSYILVGSRNHDSLRVREIVQSVPKGPAILSDSLEILTHRGRVTLNKVGPAKAWGTLELNGDHLQGDNRTTLELKVTSTSNVDTTITLESSSNVFELSTIDAKRFPSFIPTVSTERLVNRSITPRLSSFKLNYNPSAEFLTQDSSITAVPDTLLRGDTSIVSITALNLQPRSESDSLSYTLDVRSPVTGEIKSETKYYDYIPKSDTPILLRHSIRSEPLEKSNRLYIQLNYPRVQAELFDFNNTAKGSVTVREDSIPPTFQLFVNDKLFENEMFVPPTSEFSVVIYDNSHLSISDTTKNYLRINNIRIDSESGLEFSFVQTNSLSSVDLSAGIRARLRARVQLRNGSNTVRLFLFDNTGNVVNMSGFVNVAIENHFAGISAQPNPTSAESTFLVQFNSHATDHIGLIDIYNSIGQRVRTMEVNLTVGKNVVEWDGRDGSGNSLPQGTYFVRALDTSDLNVEPAVTKIIVLRN